MSKYSHHQKLAGGFPDKTLYRTPKGVCYIEDSHGMHHIDVAAAIQFQKEAPVTYSETKVTDTLVKYSFFAREEQLEELFIKARDAGWRSIEDYVLHKLLS